MLPEFQGRGIAGGSEARHRAGLGRRTSTAFHAYPSVENTPSNAICRKLGFELVGASSSSIRRATRCAATTGGSTCALSKVRRVSSPRQPAAAKTLGRRGRLERDVHLGRPH